LHITQDLTDAIHALAARHEPQTSMMFRADFTGQNDGPKVRLEEFDRFQSPDAREIGSLFVQGVQDMSTVSHPVAHACLWAAYATYNQFYFDGNKRTARHTMNALLLSRGFDSIVVPASAKTSYEDHLIEAFKTGDLTAQARFLARFYWDGLSV